MAPPPVALGLVPAAGSLGTWLLTRLALVARPHAERLLGDPAGAVGRLGDVLVWQGPAGRRVVATLEGLGESQARVEQVVGRIEEAQIGLGGSLGALTSLSMATLGVASLAAGFMAWRMNALHRRLGDLGGQISDVLDQLHAQNQAHLQTGLDFLGKFEHSRSGQDLHTALTASTHATNLYRNLVQSEAAGRRRLLALNQCGRYYLLALTAQVRCHVLANELAAAGEKLGAERPALTALARATFEGAMGTSPEAYLDPSLQADRVTLDLLAEVFRQAHELGAVGGEAVRDAGHLFERLRQRVYGAGGWFRPAGRAKTRLLAKLKYLMACLEEVGRVESLRLRVSEALAGRLSFEDLERAVVAPTGGEARPEGCEGEGAVTAFAPA
jgi:hypothetical protein